MKHTSQVVSLSIIVLSECWLADSFVQLKPCVYYVWMKSSFHCCHEPTTIVEKQLNKATFRTGSELAMVLERASSVLIVKVFCSKLATLFILDKNHLVWGQREVCSFWNACTYALDCSCIPLHYRTGRLIGWVGFSNCLRPLFLNCFH